LWICHYETASAVEESAVGSECEMSSKKKQIPRGLKPARDDNFNIDRLRAKSPSVWNLPFYGMWKDRTDMGESVEYICNLRRNIRRLG
jgi:hypothetical protein